MNLHIAMLKQRIFATFEALLLKGMQKYLFTSLFLKNVLPSFPTSFYSILSWSIKHVCVRTQGASLHADFADSRNKFRGVSVREAGVIFLPPPFHTETINWSLWKCSCRMQEQNYCHRGAFYLGILLSALGAGVPDVLVWFPPGFPVHAMLHKTERK